jgi:hypothetical protein
MRGRGKIALFVLIAAAGFGSALSLTPARGDLLPSVTLPTLPTLPVSTPTVPPAPPLPPPPPLVPPPPPLPTVPPPAAPPGQTPPTAATPRSASATRQRSGPAQARTRSRASTRSSIPVRLRHRGTLELVVRARGDCAVLRRTRSQGRPGVNRIRLGRKLRPGGYSVTVFVVRSGSRARVETLDVQLSHRGVMRARKTGPVATTCGSGSAVLPASALLIDSGKPPSATGAGAEPRHHGRSGVLGAHTALPPLPSLPHDILEPGSRSFDWAVLLLAIGASLCFLPFAVVAARAARDSRQ